jgi:parallel beta-helix repeat protein
MKTLTLLAISSILLLVLINFISATTISNSPNSYFTADNLTINNSGVNYVNSNGAVKISESAYVVCKGNNLLDDALKLFTCNSICFSTSSDCTGVLNSSLSRHNPVWRDGFYPITIYSGNAIVSSVSNQKLSAYGAILNLTSIDNTNSISIITWTNLNNIKVEGLTIQGNNLTTNYAVFFQVKNSSQVYVNNVNLSNINGFGFVTSRGSNNVVYENNFVSGNGVNDLFGGGDSNNIYIKGNTAIQGNGAYSNAIDMVNCTHCQFNDNLAYGSIIFGTESASTQYSQISNNEIYPSLNITSSGNVGGQRSDNSYNQYENNILHNGRIYVLDSNSIIKDNIVLNTTTQSSAQNYLPGYNNTIEGNEIYMNADLIALQINNNNNKILNNKIYSTSTTQFNIYLYTTSANNNLISGNILNGGRNGIYVPTASNNNIFNNIISGSNQTNSRGIEVDYNNTNIINNVISGFQYGINIQRHGNNVVSNIISNCDYGVYLTPSSSSGVTMANNTIARNLYFNMSIAGDYAGNNVQENNYLDQWSYTTSLTDRACWVNNQSVFNGRIYHNSTTWAMCVGGNVVLK